jgi:hypothetical protein
MKSNNKINKNKSNKKKRIGASSYFSSLRKNITKNKKEKKSIYKNKKPSIIIDAKKKQKNAICLIGFPEYACSSFDSIYDSIIKPNKAFVFAHIWSNGYEGVMPKVEGLLKSVKAVYHIQPQNRDKYDVSFVKGCWYNQRKPGPLSFPPNVFGQFDSAKKVMKLVKNYEKVNGKFDWIFKSRFDMHFMHPIIMNSYKNNDRVLDEIHAKPNPYPWMFQDFAFFGTSNSMHLWGKCFDSIKNIYMKHGAAFNQESIWSKNWEINNVTLRAHSEWNFHATKRLDGCHLCRSIANESKPYNAKNTSNEKWELR